MVGLVIFHSLSPQGIKGDRGPPGGPGDKGDKVHLVLMTESCALLSKFLCSLYVS